MTIGVAISNGKRTVVACDTLVGSDWERQYVKTKWAYTSQWAIMCAGLYRKTQVLQNNVKDLLDGMSDNPHRLDTLVKDLQTLWEESGLDATSSAPDVQWGDMLLVSHKKVYRICSAYSIMPHDNNKLHCVGSGGELAEGAAWALQKYGASDLAIDTLAVGAVQAAMELDWKGCGGEVWTHEFIT